MLAMTVEELESRVKIAHITDVHVQAPPRLSEMTGKRLLGTANLTSRPKVQASLAAQEAAVAAVVAADVVVFTGDLTAQHWTPSFCRTRFRSHLTFSDGDDPVITIPMSASRHPVTACAISDSGCVCTPDLIVHGDVALLTLETCRCHPSSGVTPPSNLLRPLTCWFRPRVSSPFASIAPWSAAEVNPTPSDTGALKRGCRRDSAPDAGIDAIVHGHEHHGCRTELPVSTSPSPCSTRPGHASSGSDRTLHVCFYTIEDRALTHVDRLRFDGEHFHPEPGGAWATGR